MPSLTRAAAVSCAAALLCVLSARSAFAGDGLGKLPGGSAEQGGGAGNGAVSAQVQYSTNFKEPKRGGSSYIEPTDASWTPPLCWTQPKFSAEQYKKDKQKTSPIDPESGKPLPGWDKGVDFHEGDEGAWWYRTYAVDQLTSGKVKPGDLDHCATIPGIKWVDKEDPRPPDAISPEALAGLAYAQTKLPAPPVTLRPAADHQIVNLATHVKFDAPLEPVWVTARFNHLGVDLAATTVARPVALRVDAGTGFADPQTCTYDLTNAKSGYQLDTSKDRCNITYRKSSGDGAYQLQARVTWKVTWTDSADPEGPARQPALPDGLSTFEQDVAVKEIQSINR
ncbi:hypothetical protein [Streptomyces sp. NPDC087300]|uniref:hypothetical protein n=1 Tax=Streptomyces sp. NPDC087300 TaxID=3365780 RepID=UPI003820AB6C